MFSSPKLVSAVSDIPQKPLSWARLAQALSDMQTFPFPTTCRQHAECARGGKIDADATDQMKLDLRFPLKGNVSKFHLLLTLAPCWIPFAVFLNGTCVNRN